MAISIETLKELVSADPAMRQAVEQDRVVELINSQLQAIECALKNLRIILYFQGLYATDFYHTKAKELAFTQEETKILSRVRWDARYKTPSFGWEKITRKAFPITDIDAQRFKKKPGSYLGFVGRKGKRTRQKIVLTSKAVPLQKATSSIARSSFSKEPIWAQIAGETAEEKLRLLRKQAKQLAAIAKHLSVLKTLNERK